MYDRIANGCEHSEPYYNDIGITVGFHTGIYSVRTLGAERVYADKKISRAKNLGEVLLDSPW